MSNLQTYEFANNALLKELRTGGELHSAVTQCRPFDGLLLPPQHTFEEAPHLQKSESFLQRHLLRFCDSGHLSQQFQTLDGKRGAFSDMLDSITLHLVPVAADKQPVPEQLISSEILRHCPPDATVPAKDMHANVPASLNIFLIARPLTTEEETKQYAEAVEKKSAAAAADDNVLGKGPDSKEGGKLSNTLDILFSGITNVFDKAITKPSPNKEALTKQVTTSVSASTSRFQAFQKRMQAPESKPLVKLLGQFIHQHQNREEPTTEGEVKGCIRNVMTEMLSIPLWTSGDDATDIASEGLEKYIMSKLYDKCFCVNAQERRENAALMRKLAALKQVVTPENLDCPKAPFGLPDWQRAKDELQQMNSYKCPRDKLVCGTNACVHITNALRGGADAIAAGKGDLSDKGADDYLPCVMLCVLEANPENFLSNLTFITNFRANDRIESETQYNLTVLQSAVHFWLTCQAPELKMTTEEFDIALNNIFALKKGGESPAPAPMSAPSARVPHLGSGLSSGTTTPLPLGTHMDPGAALESLTSTPPPLGAQGTDSLGNIAADEREELRKLREGNAAMETLLRRIAEAGAANRTAGGKSFDTATVGDLRESHRVAGEVFIPLAREVAQYLSQQQQQGSGMSSRTLSPTAQKK